MKYASLELARHARIFATISDEDSEKTMVCTDAKEVAALFIINGITSENIINEGCYSLSDGFMAQVHKHIAAHNETAAKNRAIIAQESQLSITADGTMVVTKQGVLVGIVSSYGEAIHMMNKADEA